MEPSGADTAGHRQQAGRATEEEEAGRRERESADATTGVARISQGSARGPVQLMPDHVAILHISCVLFCSLLLYTVDARVTERYGPFGNIRNKQRLLLVQ